MIIFIIIALILSVVGIVLLVKNYTTFSNMLWHFKHCNVIVAGKKGSGKDLLFQKIINKRKDYYYSNISYGGNHKIVCLKDVAVKDNSYLTLVNDKVNKQPHYFKESKDIYISDIGNFLPSYMDSKLYQLFPSMPLFYSLSRHLYDNNVHCNTQNIERGWKALREQADFYVQVKRTYKLPFILITKYYTYDRYESARQNLLPIKTRMINKYSKAQVDLYNAQNGDIRKGFFITRKSKIRYNTRAFEKVLLKGRRKY